jgi:hypothetical protein
LRGNRDHQQRRHSWPRQKHNDRFYPLRNNTDQAPVQIVPAETKLNGVKAITDMVVIPISIKTKGFEAYSLDAQIDTRERVSCAKSGAIPCYFWEPVQTRVKAINGEPLPISRYAPRFPILINDMPCTVTLYEYNAGANILLGQDFVHQHLPFTTEQESITMQMGDIFTKVPCSNVYKI